MNNTVTLPQSVVKRLEKLSSSSRHTPQSIIAQAIEDRLDYEEWKLEQIDAGLADIKAGRVISHDEMVEYMSLKFEKSNAIKKAA
jgi:predicted transcriptional regulator